MLRRAFIYPAHVERGIISTMSMASKNAYMATIEMTLFQENLSVSMNVLASTMEGAQFEVLRVM